MLLGSTALGLDTGFRRYDDVGWPGAIFIAMTLADTSCHVANYGASMVSGAIGTFLSTQNATTPVSSAQINLG